MNSDTGQKHSQQNRQNPYQIKVINHMCHGNEVITEGKNVSGKAAECSKYDQSKRNRYIQNI